MVASLILLSSFLPLSLEARSRSSLPPESSYVSALASADRLLHAWQSGDIESGMVLLTTHAKESATSDAVESFFSNQNPSAYEIGHGKIIKGGRYEFPVVLIGSLTQTGRAHRKFSRIVIVNTGHNDWAVDKLP